MSNIEKRIMVRVIKERLDKGEELEEIFKRYPKLKVEEIEELKNAVA